MPAAAVIPAPIAYIKVVAVKKLVVELQSRPGGPGPSGPRTACPGPGTVVRPSFRVRASADGRGRLT